MPGSENVSSLIIALRLRIRQLFSNYFTSRDLKKAKKSNITTLFDLVIQFFFKLWYYSGTSRYPVRQPRSQGQLRDRPTSYSEPSRSNRHERDFVNEITSRNTNTNGMMSLISYELNFSRTNTF